MYAGCIIEAIAGYIAKINFDFSTGLLADGKHTEKT